MDKKAFALKGDIIYSRNADELDITKDGWLVCEQGQVAGVFDTLPTRYAGIPVEDFSGKIIIPGLVDMHLHAPQYAFRGMGMDYELLEWLNRFTFPEEAKYADMQYARRAYGQFVQGMLQGGTTRACVYATLHRPATLLLMDLLEETGLVTMVGKVNMDRNGIETLQEESAQASLDETRAWLDACKGRYLRTRPILTPRFIPSCSDGLMEGLAAIQRETGLAVQSHLSENLSEVDWVKELCPGAQSYADAYLRFGLLGGEGCPTVMGHCVYSLGEEMELLARQKVWVAHCPISNSSLASGIAPVRAFLQKGMRVGLGTDVAGGYSPSILRVMAQAVQDSKLRWRLVDETLPPLGLVQVFYMATRGGGAFFGRVGAFDTGYELDALVLDDSTLPCPYELEPAQRLERLMYLGGDENVRCKYVAGTKLWQR